MEQFVSAVSATDLLLCRLLGYCQFGLLNGWRLAFHHPCIKNKTTIIRYHQDWILSLPPIWAVEAFVITKEKTLILIILE